MARIDCGVSFNLAPVLRIVAVEPELGGRFLALVGGKGRHYLKEQLLSGQEIDLSAYPTDKAGRRTITSNVNRARTQTVIYSYPVNLFEKGRRLRSGATEPGHYIITQKLKNAVAANMASYVTEWETEVLGPARATAGAG